MRKIDNYRNNTLAYYGQFPCRHRNKINGKECTLQLEKLKKKKSAKHLENQKAISEMNFA